MTNNAKKLIIKKDDYIIRLLDEELINEKITESSVTIIDNLTTNDATKALSAKQGKALSDIIGEAITYINQ